MRPDVIVVGAGPNGLTTAALLARGGLNPLVLERRETVGGAGVTEEFHPRFREAMEQLFIYLGIWSDKVFSWIDMLGMFLFIAGFIIGLGAVTVIDLHGFLGRTSSYWTEATIRTHKITKPLIWIGMFLAIIGGFITYRDIGFAGTALIHAFVAFVLLLNGCFLSYWVSPQLLNREKEGKAHEILPSSLQIKIAVSFVISVIGWWGSLFLFVWYIVVLR